jgi:UDP-N-acetylmuramyl pentapeptide phosphotransferase/UDP-N-acetylglucosamine-1-phosphate transferase
MDMNLLLNYLIVFVVLFVGILVYFRIAVKHKIFDRPNGRSSHNRITICGGGVVFFFAGLIYSLFYLPEHLYFLLGFTLLCGISFWDDISPLSAKKRIIVHFLSMTLIFYDLLLFSMLPWWQIIIAYIILVGVLNAYNFMDGINGMTGLYSLVVLICLRYVNGLVEYTDVQFIDYAILACVVFLFFNFRKRAICFAGDVGSMAISFWIVALLLQLMLKTHSVIWILFLSVYGVDSVLTIVHRLYLRQNIFEPHRMHFFQILTNDLGLPQLRVSAGYAVVQFVICSTITVLYFYSHATAWFAGIGMLFLCSLIYLLKFKLRLKSCKNEQEQCS